MMVVLAAAGVGGAGCAKGPGSLLYTVAGKVRRERLVYDCLCVCGRRA